MLLSYFTEATLILEGWPEVLRHSIRVSGLARKLAQAMGSKDPDSFALAGIMHDLGKTQWPEELHDKKGLSQDEWVIIHKHPIISAEMSKQIWPDIPHQILRMIVNHHERPDGKGTPNGADNRDLSVLTLAVADVYDALTRKRSYRGFVFTPDQAIEELMRWAPMEILSRLANMVDLGDVLPGKKAKAPEDNKTKTQSVPQRSSSACPFFFSGHYSDKGWVNLCNMTFPLDHAQLSEFCSTKTYYRCDKYMSIIAKDLSDKFKSV